MSDHVKVKLRGSNKRNIKFTYKQGDTSWHKFDAQKFRMTVSNIDKFLSNYNERYHRRRTYASLPILILFFSIFLLIVITTSIFNIAKKYITQISEDSLFAIIFAVFLILAIAIFYFAVLFKDREEYRELERIRKFKPNKKRPQKKKKQGARKKKIKEDIPWEL